MTWMGVTIPNIIIYHALLCINEIGMGMCQAHQYPKMDIWMLRLGMTTIFSDPLVPLTYASYAQMMLRGSTFGELPLS